LSRNRFALAIVPAAAAVAVALVALRLHFQPPTVPVFALAGSAGEETALHRGGRFELYARPEAPVTGAIGARGFLLREDQVRPWDPPFSVERDGAIHIAGPVDRLFADVPDGPWEVAVAVGRPENLPTAPRDVLRAREQDARSLSWRLVCQRIRLEPTASLEQPRRPLEGAPSHDMPSP
jgi:hypothetical protein